MTVGRSFLRLVTISIVCCAAFASWSANASAAGSGGWWVLSSSPAPTKLQPGQPATIITTAVNAGYEPVSGATTPTVIEDTLPEGVEVTSVVGEAGPFQPLAKLHREKHKLTCSTEGSTISCPWTGEVEPAESIRMLIRVKVSSTLANGSTVINSAQVGGGSAKAVGPIDRTIEVNSAETKFGIGHYEVRPENEFGEIETHAGSHPFQLTTLFEPNQILKEIAPQGQAVLLPNAPALVKNLNFVLPPGLIGRAAKMPQCSGADFAALTSGDANECPQNTAIGYAYNTAIVPFFVGYLVGSVPVFNLTPEQGEPARFGFEIHDVPVVLTTHVRSGKDYGVEVSVHETTQSAVILTSQLTLWGTPGDSRHNAVRGWECVQEGAYVFGEKACRTGEELETEENKQLESEKKEPHHGPEAFLTMPTTCGGAPSSSVTGEAWNNEGNFGLGEGEPFVFSFNSLFKEATGNGSGFTGCEDLEFQPSINVTPDKKQAATPSGYKVEVEVPQSGLLSPKKGVYAEADIKETKLTLPPGVSASAGAAEGLETCTSEEVGFEHPEPLSSDLGPLLANDEFNEAKVSCPEGSKIGTVEIETPLLEEKIYGGVEWKPHEVIPGGVFLAKENTSPFTSPLVLYVIAESPVSHVLVKLAGQVKPEADGQLVSVFENTPPVPFSKLTLHLEDGPRASQTTPEKCSATNESTAEFTASTGATHTAKSNFAISEGPGGSACNPAFQPSFEAGSDNSQAGAFSPFKVTIRKPDGENELRTIQVTEPLGAAAILASVTPCPTAIAEASAPETPTQASLHSAPECPGVQPDRRIDRDRRPRHRRLRRGRRTRITSGQGLPDGALPRRSVRPARHHGRDTRRTVQHRHDRRDVDDHRQRNDGSGDGHQQPAAAVRGRRPGGDQRSRDQRQPPGLRVQPDELRTAVHPEPADRLGVGPDRRTRRRRRRVRSELALPRDRLLLAPVQAHDLGQRRIERQPPRWHRHEDQGHLRGGPVEHQAHASWCSRRPCRRD